MKFVTPLLLISVVSFNVFADSPWNTDVSNDMYIHKGVTAEMCKPFVNEVIDYLYEDDSNEFYGYMHRNHPMGETEEQSFYGVSRDVDLDSKNSYGCAVIFVSHDATPEGDYKSLITFAVSESATEQSIYIDNVVEK
jgi:hypothetical protein